MFFDLVFVFTITQLTVLLAASPTRLPPPAGHLGEAVPTPAATLVAGGVAIFLCGDLCFRRSLRISPMCFKAVGAVAVLATIPLAHASAAVQLLGLTVVMVLMLVAEENARRRQLGNASSHGESITH